MNTSRKTLKNNTTLKLCETAVLLAVATVLAELKVVDLPFGGSVTAFSQVPVIVLAFRYGTPWGLVSGIMMGFIQMMFGLKNFSYVNGIGAYAILILSDYLVAYGVLGLSAVFKNKIKNQTKAIVVGAVFVSVLKYLSHITSGFTIWRGYAKTDVLSGIIKYVLTYNASYMIPELIVTIIGVIALSEMFDFSKLNLRKTKKNNNSDISQDVKDLAQVK